MRLLTKKQEEALREGAYNEALADIRAALPIENEGQLEPLIPREPTRAVRNYEELHVFVTLLRDQYLEHPGLETRQALEGAQDDLQNALYQIEPIRHGG